MAHAEGMATVAAAAATDKRRRLDVRHAIGATVIGNSFEWYDFLVYSYLATVISKNFFVGGDETAALLATFAAFGLGFVAHPLGAMVIGLIGDKYGRKPALVLTLSLMGAGTAAIGLVPSYATIGVLAGSLGVRSVGPGVFGRRRMGKLDRLHSGVGSRKTARLL